jgi:hypothetical protein
MPYKEIAEKLGKSSLACRLHYYQLEGRKTPKFDPLPHLYKSSNNSAPLFRAQEVSNGDSEPSRCTFHLTRQTLRKSEYRGNGQGQLSLDRSRLQARGRSCTHATRHPRIDIGGWSPSEMRQDRPESQEGPVMQHPRPQRIMSKNTWDALTGASSCESTDVSKVSISFLLNR